VAWTAMHITQYRRETILSNLKNSFPEKSDQELRSMLKGIYRNLSDLVVESLKAISISENELSKRVTFKNIELLENRLSHDESVIMIAIHQCNWEWVLLAGCLKLPYPIDALYLPLKNKTVDKLMFDTRSRFGGRPISVHNALVEVMKRKKNLRAFGMLADQVPPKASDKYWTTFLNQPTAFLLGTEQLPKLIKGAAVFLGIRRVKRGYYQVDLQLIAEPPYQGMPPHHIIETYKKMAEKLILENPTDWLWSHRRWKYKKPVYAT